jgi:hypothetical protein
LGISKEMLVAALTHHQVMPDFLDFIFPFGKQEYHQDFYFSGLRHQTMLQSPPGGLVVPKLGRSGREIRMCYNLKSVETSPNTKVWPWSIRQTAVYHSFDVETGKSFWVMVKGSKEIRNRIQEAAATGSVSPTNLKLFGSTGQAFASTFATHLALCDWCNEEWRWYLNYLEKRVQDVTRRALTINIDKEPSLFEEPIHPEFNSSLSLSILQSCTESTKSTISTASRRTKSGTGLEKQKIQAPFAFSQPHSPPPTLPRGIPGAMPNDDQTAADQAFTFKDLQLVQQFQDKLKEVTFVLEANIDILTGLKEHYQLIFKSDDFPEGLKSSSQAAFAQFEKQINGTITDLQWQKSRTTILQTLLADRKGLVSLHSRVSV